MITADAGYEPLFGSEQDGTTQESRISSSHATTLRELTSAFPSPHKEFPNSSKHREGKKGRKGRSKGKLKKATTKSQGVVNQEPIQQSKGLPAFNAKPMSDSDRKTLHANFPLCHGRGLACLFQAKHDTDSLSQQGQCNVHRCK